MELKSGATYDAKIKDIDEKADIALIKIDTPVSRQTLGERGRRYFIFFLFFFHLHVSSISNVRSCWSRESDPSELAGKFTFGSSFFHLFFLLSISVFSVLKFKIEFLRILISSRLFAFFRLTRFYFAKQAVEFVHLYPVVNIYLNFCLWFWLWMIVLGQNKVMSHESGCERGMWRQTERFGLGRLWVFAFSHSGMTGQPDSSQEERFYRHLCHF